MSLKRAHALLEQADAEDKTPVPPATGGPGSVQYQLEAMARSRERALGYRMEACVEAVSELVEVLEQRG